jgi:hypothetical protein
VGTNGGPQEAIVARQRQSARPCRQLRGCTGRSRQILAMTVKVQVTAVLLSCPRPGGPGGGAGQSSGAGPYIASRPDPAAGTGRNTARAPAADAGRRYARAARHLARVPGGGRRQRKTARGRLTGPQRQVVPSRHRRRSRPPGAHSCTLSGLDIPVLGPAITLSDMGGQGERARSRRSVSSRGGIEP